MAPWRCDHCSRMIEPDRSGPVPLCPTCGHLPLYRRPDGLWAEPAPSHCPQGHELVGGQALVSWQPCVCPSARTNRNGHRAWTCHCGAVITAPVCQGRQEAGRRT